MMTKKTSLRHFSLVLALLLLVGLCPTAMVTATETTPAPFFDMDLSGYDPASTETSKGITDAANDSVTEIITVSGTPALGTIPGKGIKYLEICAEGSVATGNGVKVADPAINTSALTMEFWIRNRSDGRNGASSQSEHLLLISKGGTHTMQVFNSEVSGMGYRPIQSSTQEYFTTDIKNDGSVWQHVVVTRSFDGGESNTVTVTGYVDGKKQVSIGLLPWAGTQPTDLASYVMHIGGGSYDRSVTFEGDIAVCKAYASVLTAEQVEANYTAMKDRFVAADRSLTLVSAPNNNEVIASTGTLNLTFSEAVDANTISDIELSTEGGTSVSLTKSLSEDATVLTLGYSGLEAEEIYTLSVPASITTKEDDIYFEGTKIKLRSAAASLDLLFDLDIANYNETTHKGLRDANTADTTTTVAFTSTTAEYPTKGSIVGRGIEYLNMPSTNGIKITDNALNKAAAGNVSFEMWVRNIPNPSTASWQQWFNLTNGTTNKLDIYHAGSSQYAFRLNKGSVSNNNQFQVTAAYPDYSENGPWQHHVYTISSVNDSITLKVYVNGNVVVNQEYTKTTSTWPDFNAVAVSYLQLAYGVDLAAVRAYDGVITANGALARYYAQRETYTDADSPLLLQKAPAENALIDMSGSILLRFSDTLNAASISGISLLDADGIAVQGVTAALGADGQCVTVSYNELDAFAPYTLVIPATVKSNDNVFFDGRKISLLANGDDAMTFSLDVSGYNAAADNYGLRDKSAATAANTDYITFYNTAEEAVLPEFKTVTGRGTPYLKFTGENGLKVLDAASNTAAESTLTLEFWMNNIPAPATASYKQLIMYTGAAGHRLQIQEAVSTEKYYYKFNNGNGTLNQPSNAFTATTSWSHKVITIKTTKSETVLKTYSDGVLKDVATFTGDYTKTLTDYIFYVGCYTTGGLAIDLGAFNIYNGIMTAEVAAARYADGIVDYTELNTVPAIALVENSQLFSNGTASFALKNDGTADVQAVVVTVSYDGSGALLDVSTEKVNLPGEKTTEVYCVVSPEDTSNVAKIKVFVWSNLRNLIPLLETDSIVFTQPYRL